MAENSDREIEIRTLSGESIAVHFPFTRTVQELKLLLHQIFPPATNSPNFHLFFKGSKLRLQNQIGRYPIEPGEFLVLVPFTKKSNQCEASAAAPVNDVDTASVSNLADSTWSNIMEDLSVLRETESDKLKDDDASHFKFSTFNDELEKKKMVDTTGTNCSGAKPQREFGSGKQIELPYHHILNTMQHTDEDALGEHNCEVLFKVLESINCLSDLPFGHCKLFKRARLKGVGLESYGNNGSSCLCPPWLKIVMKAFTFINIFSAFLHLQCKKTTANLLEDALNQLAKFEVKLDFQDMKQLSLLCPELICFENDLDKTSFGDVIIIINHSTGDEDKHKNPPKRGRKWLYISKIVSTLKKRDRFFRNNLWLAFSWLLSVCGDELALKVSLEDLLTSVKDQASSQSECKEKHVKRSSNTSKSDSDHVKCHHYHSAFLNH